MDEWDWQRTLDVNLTGPFLAMQRVGQVMRYQGGGVIVNIARSVARRPGLAWYGPPSSPARHGLVGLTRQAARELAADHIRVNALRFERSPETASFEDMEPLLEKLFFLCSEASRDSPGRFSKLSPASSHKTLAQLQSIIFPCVPWWKIRQARRLT